MDNRVALAAEQSREDGSSTPGPWRTFGRPIGIEILCGDRLAPTRKPSSGVRVADIRFKRVGRGGKFSGNATDEANALLIAAAPDMLAALKEISRNAALSDAWLEPVRAAIAKATGAST